WAALPRWLAAVALLGVFLWYLLKANYQNAAALQITPTQRLPKPGVILDVSSERYPYTKRLYQLHVSNERGAAAADNIRLVIESLDGQMINREIVSDDGNDISPGDSRTFRFCWEGEWMSGSGETGYSEVVFNVSGGMT